MHTHIDTQGWAVFQVPLFKYVHIWNTNTYVAVVFRTGLKKEYWGEFIVVVKSNAASLDYI